MHAISRIAVSVSVALVVSPLAATVAAEEHESILWSVDWGADGKLFAVSGEKALWIYDVETFTRQFSLSVKDTAGAVSWHPSRKLLAVAASPKDTTGIFDAELNLKATLDTTRGARDIAWNSDGKLLATAGHDGSMQTWNNDGTLLHTAKPKNGKSLTGVAWHPKQNKVISIGEFISSYDANGRLINRVNHRPNSKGMCLLLCVEWHPSGEFFVVGDYGNPETKDLPVLQFWSGDLTLLKTITLKSSAELRNIDWSPDGSRLASASDALRIWTKDGQLTKSGQSPDLLWGVRWNNTRTTLLTSSIAGRVTLWNSDAEVLKRVVEPKPAPQ